MFERKKRLNLSCGQQTAIKKLPYLLKGKYIKLYYGNNALSFNRYAVVVPNRIVKNVFARNRLKRIIYNTLQNLNSTKGIDFFIVCKHMTGKENNREKDYLEEVEELINKSKHKPKANEHERII